MTNSNGNGHDDPFDEPEEPRKKRELVRIVESVDDFKKPGQGSLIGEIESMIRNQEHWDQIRPYIESVADNGPTIFGSAKYDEFGCMYEIKKFADGNGYPLAAKATLAEIAPAAKWALRRVGMPWKLIRKQGVISRLENRRNLGGGQEAAE